MKLLKNRLFVSIVFTLACLALSHDMFSARGMRVSFDVDTTHPFTAQVYYQDATSTKYNEQQSVRHNVATGTHHVSIPLPISDIRNVRLDFGTRPGDISIRNIMLHGAKTLELDIGNFTTHHMDKYSASNNQITLTSDKDDPYIAYRDTLDLKGGIQIDWCVLFILACFYFFGFYKLYTYFPLLYRALRRPHGVLAVAFFALLFVPMLHISDATKSDAENRMLATRPTLFTAGRLNSKFGTEYDAWFNDRFFGRNTVLNINSRIQRFLSKYYHYANAGVYRDGWIFGDGKIKPTKTDAKLFSNIQDSIGSLNNWCQKNHIKCYIEIVPRKLEFAKDKIFRNVTEPDLASLLYNFLQDNGMDNIIYPLQEMLDAAKMDMVYFKTDHHWTEYGAFVGYQAFMTRLKSDFSKIKAVSDKDYKTFYDNRVRAEYERSFSRGQQCKDLLLTTECPLDVNYKYYNHHKSAEIQEKRDVSKLQKEYEFAAPNKQKIVVIGNSFAENLMEFIPYTFSKTKKIRWNTPVANNMKMSRWNKEILDFKPDILLILLESETISKLTELKD